MLIDKGSKIDVYFENIPAEFSITVAYIPRATGDSWVCYRKDGTEVRISSFSKMVAVGDGNE